ncbi:hypothetical protein EKK58_10280 [Candidatus Dependentiae bacterium]|nr:MAG: hypothetical protein EKK58_10280 [Candidatus Dependentiae bacterium]
MSIDSERPISNGAIFDAALQLKDAGLVAASAAAQVGGQAKIVDIGKGRAEGDIIIDATAVEVDSSNELYTIIAEFSNSASFASGIVPGAMLYLGHATGIPGGGDQNQVEGRYKLPFTNVINDVHYEYMRLYTLVAGTIATGVNYSAFATKR